MNLFTKKKPEKFKVIKKVLGAYIPHTLENYLRIYCLVNDTSHSIMIEQLLNEWVVGLNENGLTLEVLENELIVKTQNFIDSNPKYNINDIVFELNKKGVAVKIINSIKHYFYEKNKTSPNTK